MHHRSQSFSEENRSTEPERFFARHNQLVERLTQHDRAFVVGGMTQAHNNTGPTGLFLEIMWITLILYQYRTFTMYMVLTGSDSMAPENTEKSYIAAKHLTVLTYRLLELSGREVSLIYSHRSVLMIEHSQKADMNITSCTHLPSFP